MTALYPVEQGDGRVESAEQTHILSLPHVTRAAYHNAMITSYRQRSDFTFSAGSRLEVVVHAEGELQGTAGFGFWNHPYGLGFRLPRAVWFFFSTPPSDMPLAMDVAGNGFKAATFDAQRWPFYALLPLAPLGFLAMRIPFLYRRLWPVGQAAIGVDEFALDAGLLKTPRRYAIVWQSDHIAFLIDDAMVFSTRRVPRGKLGFVAWVDNQYAVITPQGRVGFGLIDAPDVQKLILSDLTLT